MENCLCARSTGTNVPLLEGNTIRSFHSDILKLITSTATIQFCFFSNKILSVSWCINNLNDYQPNLLKLYYTPGKWVNTQIFMMKLTETTLKHKQIVSSKVSLTYFIAWCYFFSIPSIGLFWLFSYQFFQSFVNENLFSWKSPTRWQVLDVFAW